MLGKILEKMNVKNPQSSLCETILNYYWQARTTAWQKFFRSWIEKILLLFEKYLAASSITRRPGNSGIFSAFQIEEETLKKSNLNGKKIWNLSKIASKLKSFRFFHFYFKKKLWPEIVFFEKDYHVRQILPHRLEQHDK